MTEDDESYSSGGENDPDEPHPEAEDHDPGAPSPMRARHRGPPAPAPSRDLNPQEMDKLVQLQSITGIEDLQICRALLESQEWDLEAVARAQLNLPRAPDSPRPPGPRRPPPALVEAANVRRVPVRARAAQVQPVGVWGRLLGWGVQWLQWPWVASWTLFRATFQSIFGMLGLLPGPGGTGRALARSANAADDVRRFQSQFEADFGPVHPPFFRGTYSQLLEAAKKDLKFVLVYIHSAEHEDTQAFCRSTLATSGLSDFVTQRDILFWGVSTDSYEGHRVSQALRESTYPFLAVIVLRQHRMMLVGRIEGSLSLDELTPRLERIINDNEAFIVAARADREERHLNQTIRQEQDAAFQETLRLDQEKQRKRQEAEEQKQREAEEEQQRLRDEQERKERIQRMKIELVSEIPEEPAKEDAEAVRVLIKLPGGQRLERRFLKSDSLKCLYYYVFCHPDSPDEFDITTNFPKKVLKCKPDDEPSSFQESGLGRSEMLFVNDLEA
ncbi:hypothetical protein TCAL_06854 [Tigriopus californicus]|uniref:UBX domain-containing protein n=1 Tax=Tigriopus californicus TaxID=6832 RepID=A0A553NDF8_TIGCA|nr:FAS-associated factor 2-like [Tigriopus californicus]TRY63484.1 hypothetical protein TCAL_06854 [Tigriopus californicus]|eukprot:TCALIF_06854-PA protein Name:"Similar to faf2-b FAS-associated factor 2-B (Xenopus laevis)" AED:0.04 eAED:0.04 QI:0/-1/0/1/-1/1/1/0/499